MAKTMGLDFDDVEDDSAVNMQFDYNGFESKQYLINAGSSSIFVLLLLFGWFILLLVSLIAFVIKSCAPLRLKLQRILIWN